MASPEIHVAVFDGTAESISKVVEPEMVGGQVAVRLDHGLAILDPGDLVASVDGRVVVLPADKIDQALSEVRRRASESPQDGGEKQDMPPAGPESPADGTLKVIEGGTLGEPKQPVLVALRPGKWLEKFRARQRVWMTEEQFAYLWDTQGLKYAMAELAKKYVKTVPVERVVADLRSFLHLFLVDGYARLAPTEMDKPSLWRWW